VSRLRAAVTALALAVTVILGGCTQATPNTTAVVNGVVIHESSVDEMTSGLLDASANLTLTGTRSTVVRALIFGEMADQIAASKGITLADPDIPTLAGGDAETMAVFSTAQGYRFAVLASHWQQVKTALGTDELTNTLTSLGVTLNPRYGAWADFLASSSSNVPTGSLSVVSGS
jgi:hypothetical protein